MNYYAKAIDILFDVMSHKRNPLELIREIAKLNPAIIIRAAKNISAPWMEAAIPLLKEGQKILAIKKCRELTGLGLKEAKEAVDELEKLKIKEWN
ncbi:MAG: ribosomal protein L7/L12 [Candidatus Aminicenantes bacterium]|nr:MAG: ribosomal protein L7/L12 [Candidatus Aminicenantes bacterium]